MPFVDLHMKTNPKVYVMSIMFLALQFASSSSKLPIEGTLREYCNTETFRPQCSSGEVIVIEDATYGRQHVGKCIDTEEANVFRDPRYFGCSTNVRRLLDGKCSARKTCEVRVADAELERDSPCLKGLKMFLEASYTCVPVVEEERSCVVSLTSTSLHIAAPGHSSASQSNSGLHCGTRTQPWLLEAPAGQRINISLLDFTTAANEEGSTSTGVLLPQGSRHALYQSERQDCLNGNQYGYIIEKTTAALNRKNISLCAEQESQGVINKYLSTSNNVELVLLNSDRIRNNKPSIYLVRIEAAGCTDLVPPEDAWIKREDDKIIIGCYTSRQTWQLRCQDGRWIGVVSNCTTNVAILSADAAGSSDQQQSNAYASVTDNHQVVVTVAIAFVGLAICLIIVCCGVVCLQRFYTMAVSKPHSNYGNLQQYNADDNKLTALAQP